MEQIGSISKINKPPNRTLPGFLPPRPQILPYSFRLWIAPRVCHFWKAEHGVSRGVRPGPNALVTLKHQETQTATTANPSIATGSRQYVSETGNMSTVLLLAPLKFKIHGDCCIGFQFERLSSTTLYSNLLTLRCPSVDQHADCPVRFSRCSRNHVTQTCPSPASKHATHRQKSFAY